MTTLYSHMSRPDWGTAQLIREEEGKRTFLFWDGKQRTFGTAHWKLMEPVDVGTVENTAKPAPVTPPLSASEGTDVRALRLQTRLLGDPVTKNLYERAIAEEPTAGMYGNTGYNLMRDVLEGWFVGEYQHVARGLARAIEFIEHARKVEERWGGDAYLFYRASHAESLGIAHWLNGNVLGAKEAFLAAAMAASEYFVADAKGRRTVIGSLLLRWMAAGDPQRGLDVASSVPIPKPRAHPEDLKTIRQDRFYDAYGRTLKTLAEDLVQGKPKRTVYDRAMKYVKKEIQEELSRNDYSMVDMPAHIVWMKVFAGDVLGIHDPKVAIAHLYLLMPTVKRPPEIARCLAAKSIL